MSAVLIARAMIGDLEILSIVVFGVQGEGGRSLGCLRGWLGLFGVFG